MQCSKINLQPLFKCNNCISPAKATRVPKTSNHLPYTNQEVEKYMDQSNSASKLVSIVIAQQ